MMTDGLIFLVALGVMMAGSYVLSRALDRLGDRFRISAGFMGLLAALGADSPEITSAVIALTKNEHQVSAGIILGSNLFNIAALLGLGGVLATELPIRRGPLLLNGTVSLLVTGAAALLLFRIVSPAWTLVLMAVFLIVYVGFLWRGPEAVRAPHRESQTAKAQREPWPGPLLALAILLSIAAIVAAATEVVGKALAIASVWNIPRGIVGSLMLAVLTSVPNAYTSARLARQNEGVAVVSETVNSNTINIVIGFGLSALFFGVMAREASTVLDLGWLLGMTLAAMLIPLRKQSLGRIGGALLILAYLAWVGIRIARVV